MSQASGTSASFTLPIALVGTVSGSLLTTFAHPIPLSIGTIYWPAVVLVAPFTMLGAPIGTQLCHQVPSSNLKRWFGGFLLFLGIRLLFEAALNFVG